MLRCCPVLNRFLEVWDPTVCSQHFWNVQNWFARNHVGVLTEIEKVVVEVNCLAGDFLSGSHLWDWVRCRSMGGRVYVCSDKVQAPRTLDFRVSYRMISRRVSFKFCNWHLYCEQLRILVPRTTTCFQHRFRSSSNSGQYVDSGFHFCH